MGWVLHFISYKSLRLTGFQVNASIIPIYERVYMRTFLKYTNSIYTCLWILCIADTLEWGVGRGSSLILGRHRL